MVTRKNFTKKEIDVFFDDKYNGYSKTKILNNFVNGIFIMHENFYKIQDEVDRKSWLIKSFTKKLPILIDIINNSVIDDEAFFYIIGDIYFRSKDAIIYDSNRLCFAR